ncbi:MAG: peptidylprolyl isomerase, partial [Muribaculaceae bacterium]|nr:peptidylprolyl isomerase [Muribaculaceae bacterium]
MEKIEPGKYVELTYDLYTITDGKEQLVHQSDEQDPERFVFGVTPGLVPALEKELPGKTTGDEYDVVAP